MAFLSAEIRSKEGRQLLAEGWHTKLLMGQALQYLKNLIHIVSTTLSQWNISWLHNIFFWGGGLLVHTCVYSHSNLCNLGVTRSNFVKPVSIYLRCATNTLTNKNEESSSEGPRILDSMLVFVPFDLLVNPLKGTTSNYFFAECGLLHTAVHV